ncbi:hypothetical protein GDO86_007887 [Hymenochirus boettgeri]|uniref:Leucine rich adaptor protein 1 n=1 Tax=Hymenochirus boettgeri TaxID=247094 RepID=A0A8T2IYD6_9PIPI|nr:hypothetical protein GDO86_007887 [Hymenochirus boettgeri]
MDQVSMDIIPDLKDIESKVGRKTPDGLLRWMKEDPVMHLGKIGQGQGQVGSKDQGLGEKIRDLKLELACLRAIDVKILHQLVAVNEGIEAVKWILEEKGNLTSRCSSLTSSQYSLAESQGTSRRGSWNSLQDPLDKLDSVSIGSYLDTLADDLDEYSLSTSEPVVSSTPHRPAFPFTVLDQDIGKLDSELDCFAPPIPVYTKGDREKAKMDLDYVTVSTAVQSNPEINRMPKQLHMQTALVSQMPNGSLDRHPPAVENCIDINSSSEEKTNSPPQKTGQNWKVDLDKCKLNSKLHLEYDAHWQWVQSQDDVTFL